MTDLMNLKDLAEAAVDQHNRWVAAGSPWPMWNTSLLAMQAVATPAALLVLFADYERVTNNRDMWKGQCERQSEMLRLAHEADKQLKAECEGLRDAATVSAMRIKELDLLFGRYILAMRAAVIEDEHGKTEIAGMDWIFNSLAGPGQLPPEGETDAQAYFDREIVAVDKGMEEVLAFHDQRRAAKSKEDSNG